MTIPDSDQPSPNFPEVLSRNTARLSLSMADSQNDLKAVREMLSKAQKDAKKDPNMSLSAFDDDADSVASHASETSTTTPHPSKRRRSSAHSIALVQGKAHKRKNKWATEQIELRYHNEAKQGLSMNELRFFVLNVLKAKTLCTTPLFDLAAPWKLKNVVFAFVPDLQASDFQVRKNETDLKKNPGLQALEKSASTPLSFLNEKCEYLVPTHMPESMPSPISVFLQLPLTKAGKKRRAVELSKVKLVLYDLLLTKLELESNRYPIHSSLDSSSDNNLEEGWVETANFEHEGSHTFALDCEFCQTSSGKALTRISIINFQNEVVYDQLVKPEEEITDYVTKYSGITEEMLANETTTLKDVQKKVLSLVSSSDILIGHSLNSDLNVMKLRHPNIIDTALLFEHHRGYPYKHALKYLAETYLARTIQNGEKDCTGHSSIEDLRACLDLVKLKLIEGPDFGRIIGMSLFRSAFDAKATLESSLIDYLMKEYGSLLNDVKEPILTTYVVTNDDEAVNKVIEQLASKAFQLLWLREIQYNCGRKLVPSSYTGRLLDEDSRTGGKKPTVSKDDKTKLLRDLDQRLERLYNALPAGSLLIINTGGGDPTKMNYLNYVKRLFQRQIKAGKDIADFSEEEVWNFDKATQLMEATESARQGLTLLAVKV